MNVEEVDMAVPVEGDWHKRDDGGHSVSSGSTLAEELRVAAQARRRLAFTARQRARRERDFEVVSKRLAKRLASQLAGRVSDRQAAETLRVRTYTEIVSLMSVMREDRLRETRRARSLLRCAVASGGMVIAISFAAAGWLPGR